MKIMVASLEFQTLRGNDIAARRSRALFTKVSNLRVMTRPHGRLKVIFEWDKSLLANETPGPTWRSVLSNGSVHVHVVVPGASEDPAPLVYRVLSNTIEFAPKENPRFLGFEIAPTHECSDRAIGVTSRLALTKTTGLLSKPIPEICSVVIVMNSHDRVTMRLRVPDYAHAPDKSPLTG